MFNKSLFLQGNLEKLNQIVWPAIAELAQVEIEQYRERGKALQLMFHVVR